MFDTSYDSGRETDFKSTRVDIKLQQCHWSMQYRPRELGRIACSKVILKTITKQGLTLTELCHCYRETNFNAKDNIKYNKVIGV